MLEKSYIYAPIILILVFFCCLIIVLGIKALISSFKVRTPSPAPAEKPKPKRVRAQKPKTIKPIRSIEINPQEIDRIYVRKAE